MSADWKTWVHLIAGGVGGTCGAILTCPLEVLKTRQQSSCCHFSQTVSYVPSPMFTTQHRAKYSTSTSMAVMVDSSSNVPNRPRLQILACLRHIYRTEGGRALFKGLGPNLLGVAPSRAIYFFSYAKSKKYFNAVCAPDTWVVHLSSAAVAGFTACTLTNPIWLVKTRLQLDQKKNGSLTMRQCILKIGRTQGIPGFYKGITASYYGISETMIHFVIYEYVKRYLVEYGGSTLAEDRTFSDFFRFMAAGAISKTIASCIAYPHEVARTRLREEGNKYKSFFQTLGTVLREEGRRGLYRGLGTQLVRQIPNTAVMMSTYEATVYVLTKFCGNGYHDDDDYDND